MSCRPLEEDIMSRLPTRVIVTDNDGTEVDRGRWLGASGHGITISSDTDPTGWIRDYRYPAYRTEFESAELPPAAPGPVPVAPAASPGPVPVAPAASPVGELGRGSPYQTPQPRESPAMQLDPDTGYALGGPLTP